MSMCPQSTKCTAAPLFLRPLSVKAFCTLSAHLTAALRILTKIFSNKVACTLRDPSFLRMYPLCTTGVYTLGCAQRSKGMLMGTYVLPACTQQTANASLLLHSVCSFFSRVFHLFSEIEDLVYFPLTLGTRRSISRNLRGAEEFWPTSDTFDFHLRFNRDREQHRSLAAVCIGSVPESFFFGRQNQDPIFYFPVPVRSVQEMARSVCVCLVYPSVGGVDKTTSDASLSAD